MHLLSSKLFSQLPSQKHPPTATCTHHPCKQPSKTTKITQHAPHITSSIFCAWPGSQAAWTPIRPVSFSVRCLHSAHHTIQQQTYKAGCSTPPPLASCISNSTASSQGTLQIDLKEERRKDSCTNRTSRPASSAPGPDHARPECPSGPCHSACSTHTEPTTPLTATVKPAAIAPPHAFAYSSHDSTQPCKAV